MADLFIEYSPKPGAFFHHDMDWPAKGSEEPQSSPASRKSRVTTARGIATSGKEEKIAEFQLEEHPRSVSDTSYLRARPRKGGPTHTKCNNVDTAPITSHPATLLF